MRLIAVNALNISKPDYGHELWNNLAEEYTGKLVGVIDGDTIEILHKQHTDVSVSMVDCPENGQADGKRAKQRATETVQGGMRSPFKPTGMTSTVAPFET